MNISQESTGELTATIRIELLPEDYQEKVEKKLRDYRQKANMPGFRPGMVPMGLIRKMYAKALLAEEVTQIINDSLTNYLTENNINTLGSPLANEEKTSKPDWDNPGNLEFFFDIGISPDIDPELGQDIEAEYIRISLSDEEIEKEISNICRSYGDFEPVEVSEADDWLTVDISELDHEGNVHVDGIKHNRRISNRTFDDATVSEKLTGLKVGDSFVINPKTVLGDPARIGFLLNITAEKAATLEADFRFTVTTIERIRPAEMNEELFNKIFPGVSINSRDEFAAALRKDMEHNYDHESEAAFFGNVRKKLMELYHPALPEEFLKRWIIEKDEEPHEHEHEHEHGDSQHIHDTKDWPKIFESMRWQLIENRIISKYGLKVEQQDVRNYVKERYRRYFSNQGTLSANTEIQEETLNMLAESYLKKKDEADQIVDLLYNDRLISLFRDKMNVTYRTVGHDEFHELAGTHHH